MFNSWINFAEALEQLKKLSKVNKDHIPSNNDDALKRAESALEEREKVITTMRQDIANLRKLKLSG